MNATIGTPQPLESVGLSAVPQALPLPPFLKTSLAVAQRRKHKWIATIAAIIAMFFIAIVIFHGYVAWMLAYPYVAPLASNPKEAIGIDYEEVIYPSHSGETTVSGWYLPAPAVDGSSDFSKRTVVFSHGYGANREESWVPMYDLAKLLHDLSYNVLLFDSAMPPNNTRLPLQEAERNRSNCWLPSTTRVPAARRISSYGDSPWVRARRSRRRS